MQLSVPLSDFAFSENTQSSICARHKIRTFGAELISEKIIKACTSNLKPGFNSKETLMNWNKNVREPHQALEIIMQNTIIRIIPHHWT